MSRLTKSPQLRFILWLALWLSAMACLAVYVSAGSPKLHLSSQNAIQELSGSEDQVVFDYETESLRIVAVSGEHGEPKLYAVKKWMGFWVLDYPSKRNIQGITYGGDDDYVYFLDATGSTVYLQMQGGDKIYPLESRSLPAGDAGTNGKYAISVFRIGGYAGKPGNYQLVMQDTSGKTINSKTDELDFDSIALFYGTGDEDSLLLEYLPGDISRLDDDRARLIDVFKQNISGKIPTGPVAFESTKMPEVQKHIHTSTALGTYYKVEGKHKIYRWDHKVNYHLVMNGEYQGVLLRHETNYMNHNLFEDGLSAISSSYKVEPGRELDELLRIFHLFFPQG